MTVSSNEALHVAINSRFHTSVATPQSLTTKVQYDNAPFDPPDNATWVRVSILAGEPVTVEFGDSMRYRTPGVMDALISIPIESGTKDALELADVIAAAFRYVTAGGVTYGLPGVRTMGRSGSWWQINVSCPFYADTVE